MAISKIECLWQLLLTNDFKEDFPSTFHCIICKNVTIEPYLSFCECRFCSKCIKEYLKNERKYCPGIKDECKEEYLEINLNVTRDVVAIRNIGRISVKCLNEMCEVRCDLENMNNHLRVCGMSKTKCPCENIGCQLRQISRDNVKTHYDNEWFSHTKLLVEAIDNLRNDVEELKKVIEIKDEQINKLNEGYAITEMEINKMRIDIDTLKEINERKDIEIEEMKEDLRMMKETQRKKMMEELENIKKDIPEKDVREDFEDQKKSSNYLRILINEIKEQIDDQRKEIDELKIKDERRDREMETQQKTMMKELKNVKRDIVERDLRGDIEDQRKILNDLRVNQENIEREMNSVVIKVRDARIFDEREFIWRINDFSKMREDRRARGVILRRYSLKLYLSLWCDGDYLRFYCRILRGEFDNYLEWPMKHKITLSLINHATGKSHKSVEYHRDSFEGGKSVFNKPQSELWNNPFGDYKFTTFKEITETPELLLDDSLIVSFNIEYN